MLIVHHLGNSQSERVVWLLEELALPYRLVRYERDPATRLAPSAYKALHAFGTAPVLDDGDLRLTESGAIVEYVIHTHGAGRFSLRPGAPNYADFLFWWHFANGSMMPAAMTNGLVARLGGGDDPLARSLSARLDLAYDMVEARLKNVPYFAGEELTGADILMLFPLTTMRRFSPRDISGYPAIQAYLQRVGARPAYQRAMAKAEPNLAPMLS
ncbi:glutathione S-transferase family protein [Bradyrhizobium sp. BR 1432]|uniref:glutathione S-transferase family protein n=1 Tax=Bradyrhizobium sp. BR 1432 TaxID=3447966 RepID=UPI003EE4AA8B